VNLEKVVLIGPMGVGKSTLGKIVASRLNWTYFDNDIDMAKTANTSIEQLSKMSVEQLHELEADFILEIIASNGPFIAGAAASVIENENVQRALKEINTIYLSIPLSEIYKRTSAGTVGRQALNQQSDIVKERFLRRDPLYKKYARKTLNLSKNPNSDAELLLNLIKQN
jgi:shikimate kinase